MARKKNKEEIILGDAENKRDYEQEVEENG